MNKIINGLMTYRRGNPLNLPIVWIHGFPYDHSMWQNQIRYFERDYYNLAYDVRGLGNSETGDGQYTMESYVDDLIKVIRALGLEKPVLCGLSMGGYISLRAVEREPDLFSGLVLLDTRSEADDDAGKLKRASAIKMINVSGVDKFVEFFIPTTFGARTIQNKNEVFTKTLNYYKEQNPIGVKGALIAMLSRTDTTANLGKIKFPVLVLVGEEDTLTPPAVMKGLADKIRKNYFRIIPDVGHMTPIESPDEVNREIEAYLKSL